MHSSNVHQASSHPPAVIVPLQRDVSRAARHQICDWLRAEILEVRLQPGAPIAETEIAARFHASRTPVREALLRLSNEGLVDIVPQVGSFVAKLQLQRIREALFVREVIECEVVRRLALTPGSHPALARLSDVMKAHARAIAARDIRMTFAADDEFHRTLVEAAGLPGVWETLTRARQLHSRIRALSMPELKGAEMSVTQHGTVLKRILAGDADRAEAAMRDHIGLNQGFAQTIAERYPAYFQADG